MADKRKSDEIEAEALLPDPPQLVESLPSAQNQISGLASAAAPFVFFENVPFFGIAGGVGAITLTAQRHMCQLSDGSVGSDYVVTGLLRAPIPSMIALRDTIDLLLKTAARAEMPGRGDAVN